MKSCWPIKTFAVLSVARLYTNKPTIGKNRLWTMTMKPARSGLFYVVSVTGNLVFMNVGEMNFYSTLIDFPMILSKIHNPVQLPAAYPAA